MVAPLQYNGELYSHVKKATSLGGVVASIEHVADDIEQAKKLDGGVKITGISYKEGFILGIDPLNISSNVLDLSYARNDSVKSIINSQGQIQQAAYNLIKNSNDFQGSNWTLASITVTPAYNQNPFELGVDANRFVVPSSGGTLLNDLFTDAGKVYTYSVWMKSNTASNYNVQHYWATGDMVVTPTWKRFVKTFTSFNGLNDSDLIFPECDISVWGAQLVEGRGPMPYLKTTTRNNIPAVDFSSGKPAFSLEPSRTNLFEQSDLLSTQTINVPIGSYSLSFYGTGSITFLQASAPVTVTGTSDSVRTLYYPYFSGGNVTFTVSGNVKFAQLEKGVFETSYIKTNASSVTRQSDTFALSNMVSKGITSNSGGTFYLHIVNNIAFTREAPNLLFELLSTSLSSVVRVQTSSGVSRLNLVIRGTAIPTSTDELKLVVKWNGSVLDAFLNGTQVITNLAFSATDINNLEYYDNGHKMYLAGIYVSPTPLSNSQCIELSKI